MVLVEGEVWDAVLEGVWGLASVAALLPGLMWVWGEEGFRGVATHSVAREPLFPGHTSRPLIPSTRGHHLLLAKHPLPRK